MKKKQYKSNPEVIKSASTYGNEISKTKTNAKNKNKHETGII